MSNPRCNAWHGRHKWSRWISRDVPHDIEITSSYHMSIMGSHMETIKYKTVIAVMSRYCECCDLKESRQAALTREAKANHRSILADQVDAMVLDGGQTLTKETVVEWDRNGVAKIASTPNKQGTK